MKRLRRWLRLRRGTFGPRPTVLGVVKATATLVLAVALFASPAVAYYQEPGLNGVASVLAGKKVEVRCLTDDEEAADPAIAVEGAEAYVEGWYDFRGRWRPKPYTVFKGEHCDVLFRAAKGDLDGVTLEDFAWSLLVLVHESGHLRGAKWSGDEAKTQCWAMNHFKSALNQLGFRSPEQHRLVTWQMVDIHLNQIPPSYQLPGCRLPTP